jgi:uncharacterized protein with HEPN domain
MKSEKLYLQDILEKIERIERYTIQGKASRNSIVE